MNPPYDGQMEVAAADTGVTHGIEPPDAPSRRRRPAWFGPAVVGAAALAGCVGVLALNPVEESNPPICPFKMMTGLDCPGCGATRATNALLRGNLGAAVDHNLLFVVLLPLALVAYAVWALRSVGVAQLSQVRMPRHWLAVTIGLVLAFWALRLLPWEPFTRLASGA